MSKYIIKAMYLENSNIIELDNVMVIKLLYIKSSTAVLNVIQ